MTSWPSMLLLAANRSYQTVLPNEYTLWSLTPSDEGAGILSFHRRAVAPSLRCQ